MKVPATIAMAATMLASWAPVALACATCFAASSPRALLAYYLSTILLTAMPFALTAAFLLFLRRHRLGAPPAPEAAPAAND